MLSLFLFPRPCRKLYETGPWMLSALELRDIAARAASVDERLAGGCEPVPTSASETSAARAAARWLQLAADGDPSLFTRRLARDHLDWSFLKPLLGHLRLRPGHPDPPWTGTFRWLLDAIGTPVPHPGAAVPFEDLLAPLAAACTRRIPAWNSPAVARLLTQEAALSLERSLLLRLSECLTPTLLERFTLFQLSRQPFANVLALPAALPSSRAGYDTFLSALGNGLLRECFLARPVLARLLATVAGQWIDAVNELLLHLAADFDALRAAFHSGIDPGPVTGILPGRSDPHNNGRTVAILTFSDGLRLVYKPRSLGIDAAWRNLLHWLDRSGAPVSIPAPAVLSRRRHGWVEFIHPEPCQNAREARLFFTRCGAILCLVCVLAGTDLNFENMIAAGGRPVLIDIETLMHPSLVRPTGADGPKAALIAAAGLLRDSVLAPGFLPNWMVVPGARLAGIGALNPAEPRQFGQWTVRYPNTDAMALQYAPEPAASTPHLPVLHGKRLSSAAYPREIAAGFEATYRFLMDHRAALLDPAGPLRKFRGQSVRVVLRPTQLYALILARAAQPANLASGASWSLEFELLSRFAAWDEPADPFWSLLRAEREALARLDIPYFTARAAGARLLTGGGADTGVRLHKSGFQRTVARLRTLSPQDLERQLAFIRLSLETAAPARSSQGGPWAPARDPGQTLLPEAALRIARRFARLLENQAVQANGGAAWIGAVAMPREERSQLRIIGFDLYSGASGVALFLAALERLTGGDGLRELARAALAPLRSELASPANGPRLARVLGLGGGAGLGSIIYALTHAAVLLDDDSLLRDALRAAGLITPARIAEDRFLDVIAGAAGAIFGLLTLYHVSKDDAVFQKAVLCGRQLVSRQDSGDAPGRAWRTIEDVPLTGFSHGAAGIALALLRLYAAAGDRDFLAAAIAGIHFERTAFSPLLGNWLDFRPPLDHEPDPEPPCQWCHGAPGIALARLGGLSVLDNDRIRQDIDIALRTTQAYPLGPTDHLCCGNAGRLETLFAAGTLLPNPSLTALARHRAAQLLDCRGHPPNFLWAAGADTHNPGFFTGISGLGYELLRLCFPNNLPSVLLFEPPAGFQPLTRSSRSG